MGLFCLIYSRHRRKKFCKIGAYNNTKVFIRKVSLRLYTKSKFCVCFEVHMPVANIFQGRTEYELMYGIPGAKHGADYSVHI